MPFLKKLRLHGFKSFAYKTEFEFKDGITGIVGPNGCGKTNIVDSLKWGFGERGAKSLRGESVTDIIFAGTEIHKPVGLAEVSIIADNSNLGLPLKFNEISIKRRVFRSGEPEYYINNNNVRLKDIHDLFADTGVGKSTYSFMEQGKIDLILNAKPDERRIIFEEAAGIARYKERRKESLAKLGLTKNNLDQVNVLLKELENEKKSLKNQAEKAMIFSRKKEKQKELEIQLFGNKYKNNIRELKDINNKIADLKDQKIKLKTQNSSINSEIEKIQHAIFKYNQNKNKFEKDRLTYEQKISANNGKIDIFTGLYEENSNNIKLKKEQINNIRNENKKIEKDIAALKQNLGKLKKEQEENENALKNVNEQCKLLIEKKELNIQKKDNLLENITNSSKQVENLRIDLRKVTDEFVAQIDRKKKELDGKQDGHIDIKAEINSLLDKIIGSLKIASSNEDINDTKEIISDMTNLKKEIEDFTNRQVEFRNLIFAEKGPYAKKERIDKRINLLLQSIISNQNVISRVESENKQFTRKISDLTEKYNKLDKMKNDLKHHISNHNKDIQSYKGSLARNNSYLKDLESEISNIENNTFKLKSDIKKLNKEIETYGGKCTDIDKRILKFEQEMNTHQETISKRKGKIHKLLHSLDKLEKSAGNHVESKYKIESRLNEFKRHLYQEYNIKVDEILEKISDKIDEKKISENINKIKQEIKDIGYVNLLAEELYDDVNKRYKFHVEQKDDLLKAQDDLMKIINEVNKESKKLFLNTFNQIRKNFHELFRRIFEGGKADLILLEPDNVLESGIEINAQPPGKKINSYDWLSGGERTLVAIGLMFSIFQVKPSPFCVLDEIDAALDEQSNLKFLKLLREFTKNTQFIIITHNKQTIVNCDYLYGITMEEKGISKVVSIELKKEKIDEFVK